MNKVIQSGYVATEPEIRTTDSGVHKATFRIAVQRRFANAQGVREADYFTVVAWRQNADFVGKYLRKGRKIFLEGELQNNSYTAQDGSKRHNDQIIASNIEFADSKPQTNDGGASQAKPAQNSPQSSMEEQGFQQVDDDELPF